MRTLLMRIACLFVLVGLIVAPATAAPAFADMGNQFALGYKHVTNTGVASWIAHGAPAIRDGYFGRSSMRLAVHAFHTPCWGTGRIGWTQLGHIERGRVVGHWVIEDVNCRREEGFFFWPTGAVGYNLEISRTASGGTWGLYFYDDTPEATQFLGMNVAESAESGGQTTCACNGMGQSDNWHVRYRDTNHSTWHNMDTRENFITQSHWFIAQLPYANAWVVGGNN